MVEVLKPLGPLKTSRVLRTTYYLSRLETDWFSARQHCVDHHLRLLSIEDLEEDSEITNFLNDERVTRVSAQAESSYKVTPYAILYFTTEIICRYGPVPMTWTEMDSLCGLQLFVPWCILTGIELVFEEILVATAFTLLLIGTGAMVHTDGKKIIVPIA
ncbi:unnamed protein product [Orchesella dallaii]|uniref:C-type lectin domain-containing protein n=1 Tax=Orchesella dallaii TaxID=48710 RepID=A0ABP1QUF3_9HEXA